MGVLTHKIYSPFSKNIIKSVTLLFVVTFVRRHSIAPYYRLSKLVPESIPQSSCASTSSEGLKLCLSEASSAEFCANLTSLDKAIAD